MSQLKNSSRNQNPGHHHVASAAEPAHRLQTGAVASSSDSVSVAPLFRTWGIAAGGLTAVGVAWAAAYASTSSEERGVGIAAWVCSAVIGTAAVIASARNA
jgi:hypothetical protein